MTKKGKVKPLEQPAITVEPIEPEQETANSKAIKPRQFRKTAQKEIGEKYKQIVETLANKAVGGSVQHTKLLFDLGGVKEEVRATSPRHRKPPSLGKLLLDEVAAMKRRKQKAAEGGEEAK